MPDACVKLPVFYVLQTGIMWSSHLIGIGLVSLAFFFFAQGILARQKGKRFNPWPTFILLLVAIIYQFSYAEAGFFRRIPHLLLDFGAGMALASVFLAIRKFNHKLFLVPGILGVLIGGGLYAVTYVYDGLKDNEFCSASSHNHEPYELLVELGEDDNIEEEAIQNLLDRYGASYEKAFPEVTFEEDSDLSQYYVVNVCPDKAERLKRELNADTENIDQADKNHQYEFVQPEAVSTSKVEGQFAVNDPYFGQQWYAQALGYEQVYALLRDQQPVRKAKVAVVDTGVEPDHEDLSSIYDRSGTDGDYDKHSHGTHCAGLAGAIANNQRGVASMNYEGRFVSISGYAALDDYGRGTDLRVSRAIIKAADDGADVISMSLGGPAFGGRAPKSQIDAIRYARKKGAIVVVAAGNSNQNARGFAPANIDGVICVSAIGPDLKKASFSNTNTSLKMPIASPGVNILSTVPGSKYQSYNGTSMATPIVSGLVGIMRSLNPELSTEQVYEMLHDTGFTGEDASKVGRMIQPVSVIEQLLGNR